MARRVDFADWTRGRVLPSYGTNAGATELPFQGWRRFKEAFAPELVARAARENGRPTKVCLDPFGGSGTTALACQFLGIFPGIIEVNPYLADLIEAKLGTYNADSVAEDFRRVVRWAAAIDPDRSYWDYLPRTFVEPGVGRRWVFSRPVADQIARLRSAIEMVESESHQRLFRVLLGGILVDISNVVVSGKGRRYRRNWETRTESAGRVSGAFSRAVAAAARDINAFAGRSILEYEILRGDARALTTMLPKADLAVFSPPYPNSFDYTDVYNIELWMLGYISDTESNRSLRLATLSSHVQLYRPFQSAPAGFPNLDATLAKLDETRASHWSPWIPEMVGAYFHDLSAVLTAISRRLESGGSVWMVVGDSRYSGVLVPTAAVVSELAPSCGLAVTNVEPFRSMRASPQQGGRHDLAETLIVMTPA